MTISPQASLSGWIRLDRRAPISPRIRTDSGEARATSTQIELGALVVDCKLQSEREILALGDCESRLQCSSLLGAVIDTLDTPRLSEGYAQRLFRRPGGSAYERAAGLERRRPSVPAV